jgi:RNA polymerase sigma-70 factor (ECF subfamily)
MTSTTDEQLVAAARTGDMNAFEELVRRHESRVASTVIGMLGNSPEADDVGQETFIRFYKALDMYRGESNVGTYITRIAINLSLNELKRRKKRFSLFIRTSTDEVTDIPDNRSSGLPFEDREVVQQALRKLKPDYRAVLVLRFLNGFSTVETANILNVPVGTVLSRLARAQQKLKELLTSEFGEIK